MFFSFKLFFSLLAFAAMAFAQTTPNVSEALFNLGQSADIVEVIEFAEKQVPTVPGLSELDAAIQQLQNAGGK